MIRSFASPDLLAVWRGRQPECMHPRLAFAVRRDLAIIHAAIDQNDLLQACGERLQPLEDPSMPFDADPNADPNGIPINSADEITALGAPNEMKTLRVGYGWWLIFQFRAGDAQGIDLEAIPEPSDD